RRLRGRAGGAGRAHGRGRRPAGAEERADRRAGVPRRHPRGGARRGRRGPGARPSAGQRDRAVRGHGRRGRLSPRHDRAAGLRRAMAQVSEGPTRAAADGFERYYTEKLWEWIPEVYRDADGRADNPGKGTLRALIELIAGQAAIIRRDIDRLGDDQQITLADDWAVPYIGDLLGTRPVSEQNRRGQRIAVARTIHYRRRKGTVPVLEALIHDIGDL